MKKRYLIALVLVGALAGAVWWTFLRPPPFVSDRNLLSFLPAESESAVFHRNLESHWLAIRQSNWLKKLIARPELKRWAHKNDLDKPEPSDTEKWILDIIGERALAAYVPNPQRPGRYSLFIFAPLGNRAKRLEMWADILQHGDKMGFKLQTSRHNGQEVVRVAVEGWPPDVVVKYAKVRNVAAIVISETEDTLERYLDAPPATSSKLADGFAAHINEATWVQLGAVADNSGVLRWIATIESGAGSRTNTLRIAASAPLQPRSLTTATAGVSLADRMPADALMRFSGRFSEWSAIGGAFAKFVPGQANATPTGPLSRLRQKAPWLGDNFAIAMPPWRAVSDRVPVAAPQLTMAVECTDQQQARAAIQEFVQSINSRTDVQIAIVPGSTSRGVAIERVQPTAKGWRKMMAHWPGFAFDNTALLAASADDLVPALLATKPLSSSSDGGNKFFWKVGPTREAVRGALSAYSMYLLFSGGEPPAAVAPWLPRLEILLDALAPIKAVTAIGSTTGGEAGLTIDVSYADISNQKR